MPADVEYRVVIFRSHIGQPEGLGKMLLRGLILLEPRHGRRLTFRKIALRIDRWLSTFWRSQRQPYAGVFENKVGCREFLKPETGLAAGVAELIVRCCHHQYFHRCSST